MYTVGVAGHKNSINPENDLERLVSGGYCPATYSNYTIFIIKSFCVW